MAAPLATGSLVLGLAALSACSTRPPLCQAKNAFIGGQKQALAGQAMAPKGARSCGDQGQSFRKNWSLGHQSGLKTYCTVDRALEDGVDAGGTGTRSMPNYGICSDPPPMVAAFERGLALGLRRFCLGENALTQARSDGINGHDLTVDFRPYQACGAGRGQQIEAQAWAAYRGGSELLCRHLPDVFAKSGDEHGRSGHSAQPVADYKRCEPDLNQRIKRAYREAYRKSLRSHCSDEHIRRSASQAAARETPELPANLSACWTTFPETVGEFRRIYRRVRSAYVAQHCTRDRGLRDGRWYARRGRRASTRRPDFCDKEKYPAYRAGFQAGLKSRGAPPRGTSAMQPPVYAGASVEQACNREFFSTGYRESCFAHGRDARTQPPRFIGECGERFTSSSDKLECMSLAARSRRNPTPAISTCGTEYFSTDAKLDCIRRKLR